MKIVITGGAGFIGSHVAEYWVNQNAEVIVIDNLRSGYSENINHIPDVKFVNGSITNAELIDELIDGALYVHHFAAMVSVPESIEKPEECLDINVKGLLNILNSSVKHKVKKVIHSSSAAVYGDLPELPKSVNSRVNPKSPYGITKLDGEYYLQVFNEQYGLDTISLRYFNVFGPRQDPGSQYAAAIPIFIENALKARTIKIYGDGEQTRDFIYVDDVVKANIIAATKQNVNGVFNVANGRATSIKQLAEMIIKQTGSKSRIEFYKERSGDIKHSLADIELTTRCLGFIPEVSLSDGLSRTIEFFRKITL